MTIYGYARVLTDGQTLDAQVSALKAAGAEKVYSEKQSGAKTDRAAAQHRCVWWSFFGGCQMSFSRFFPPIAAIFLGLSASVAQPLAVSPQAAPKLPACSQSMIAGTWQAFFNSVGGYGANLILYCSMTLSSSGQLTNVNCTGENSQQYGILVQPAGTLTINRTCHVAGSLTYSICGQPCSCCEYTSRTNVSLFVAFH
jgi:hypothetical protein